MKSSPGRLVLLEVVQEPVLPSPASSAPRSPRRACPRAGRPGSWGQHPRGCRDRRGLRRSQAVDLVHCWPLLQVLEVEVLRYCHQVLPCWREVRFQMRHLLLWELLQYRVVQEARK